MFITWCSLMACSDFHSPVVILASVTQYKPLTLVARSLCSTSHSTNSSNLHFERRFTFVWTGTRLTSIKYFLLFIYQYNHIIFKILKL